MIDFHTHLLPAVDDGSKSVEESLDMLRMLLEQGVDRVVATPHFYADRESAERFLSRRAEAFFRLKQQAADRPLILLGAEVKYYSGISRLRDLCDLRIEGSKLLLLEMPFTRWTEYAVREVEDIALSGRITPVLAHVERYLPMKNEAVLPRLLESGVLLQANASFFAGRLSRHKAVKMVKRGQIHFIGSDCHNTADRPPNVKQALRVLEKKTDSAFLEAFVRYGDDLFSENKLV